MDCFILLHSALQGFAYVLFILLHLLHSFHSRQNTCARLHHSTSFCFILRRRRKTVPAPAFFILDHSLHLFHSAQTSLVSPLDSQISKLVIPDIQIFQGHRRRQIHLGEVLHSFQVRRGFRCMFSEEFLRVYTSSSPVLLPLHPFHFMHDTEGLRNLHTHSSAFPAR